MARRLFSYRSMPLDVAERNVRLFADKVLPATQSFRQAEAPLAVS